MSCSRSVIADCKVVLRLSCLISSPCWICCCCACCWASLNSLCLCASSASCWLICRSTASWFCCCSIWFCCCWIVLLASRSCCPAGVCCVSCALWAGVSNGIVCCSNGSVCCPALSNSACVGSGVTTGAGCCGISDNWFKASFNLLFILK